MKGKSNWIKYVVSAVLILLFAVAGFCIGFFLLPERDAEVKPVPQKTEESLKTETEEIKTAETFPTETEEKCPTYVKVPLMKGIDVSKWQGKPNWKKIAASGVEFAMIRIGFHGTSGSFGEDPSADHNLKGADENGILTGVYFYSLAKDASEAEAEAEWVLSKVGKYAVSLPIVIDYEMMENDASATAAQRTDIALAFLRTVQSAGYEGMLYVPIDEWNNDKLWEKDRILSEFKVWGADYETPSDQGHPDGVTNYAMWQYSNTGLVEGISGNVDLNYAYFTAERSEPLENGEGNTQNQTAPQKEFNQTFTAANRRVTAKIEVNLRKIPSIEGEVVGSLIKGEYVLCTGDSDMGWSRLEYKGQRVFAVTSYLVDENGNSIKTPESFAPASDSVTAKEVVNLRLAPNTDAQIAGTLKHGEVLKRTGIGDKGWSRLDYNGVTVYAVTSYLENA